MLKTPRERLNEAIAAKSVRMLIDVARSINRNTDVASMLVANRVAEELEKRMPEAAFVALMEDLYADLTAA